MDYTKLSRAELERKRDKRLKFMSYRIGMKAWLKHRAVYDACVEELIRRDSLTTEK